jgi:uncharacterized membrane protein
MRSAIIILATGFTLARLAGQPPEIAFSVGQACWFGLLLIGCVGVVYNLMRHEARSPRTALMGGLLAAVAVGITGNLQGIFEWLYANGVPIDGLARWFAVNGFPDNATATGNWYIGFDWWWWRSSRVLQDLDLLGRHIEVIDEFPFFSYILGDNHPHVLAMPVVLLVIGLAQNLFFGCQPVRRIAAATPSRQAEPADPPLAQPAATALGITAQSNPSLGVNPAQVRTLGRDVLQVAQMALPGGWLGFLVLVIAAGSLVFLNTWDFPPYWLLLMAGLFALVLRLGPPTLDPARVGRATLLAVLFGVGLLVAIVVLYLPYFLTAQSQAGGFVPNLFNPTRFPQFFLMFGAALVGMTTLLSLAWSQRSVAPRTLVTSFALVYGVPLLFLVGSIGLALRTETGAQLLSRMELPAGTTDYVTFIVRRWSTQGLTFLVIGALLALTLAAIWQRLAYNGDDDLAARRSIQSMSFVLFLAAIGLLLVYAPEFVFLRDNFGTRMNTIFKFYYQAWLLFGLSTSYAIVTAFSGLPQRATPGALRALQPATRPLALLALLLTLAGLIYPLAATYSKTGGFATATPTFDATAYIASEAPAESAAIQWVRANTAPTALIIEAKGASYRANYSRISATTGRATLLGWDGHESQWRGTAYGQMAQGRVEALELIYRGGSPDQIAQTLDLWRIDYVYIGRTERDEYGLTPLAEERLAQVMDLVFAQDDVHIYQRRSR